MVADKMGLGLNNARLLSFAMLLSIVLHGIALSYLSITTHPTQGLRNETVITVKLAAKAQNTHHPQLTSDTVVDTKQRPRQPITPKPLPRAVKKRSEPVTTKKKPAINKEPTDPGHIPGLKPAVNPQQNTSQTPSSNPMTAKAIEGSFPDNTSLEPEAKTVVPSTVHPQTPAYLNNPAPLYPIAAKRRGIQGLVLLEVSVSAMGMASKIIVKRSSGYTILDRAATEAVAAWRFIPATQDGKEIEATVLIPVRFELIQGAYKPSTNAGTKSESG